MKSLIPCSRILSVLIAALLPACDTDFAEAPPPAPPSWDAVELIGINGRRLHHGDHYRAPLEQSRSLPLAALTREAFAVVNHNPVPVTVALTLLETSELSSNTWFLLGPHRGEVTPWPAAASSPEASFVTLAATSQLDFDVGLWPRTVGATAAWLGLSLIGPHRGASAVRWIRLEAVVGPLDASSPAR